MVKLNFKQFMNEVTAQQVQGLADILYKAAANPAATKNAADNMIKNAKNPAMKDVMAKARTPQEFLNSTMQQVQNAKANLQKVLGMLTPQQANEILTKGDKGVDAVIQQMGPGKPNTMALLGVRQYLSQPLAKKLLQNKAQGAEAAAAGNQLKPDPRAQQPDPNAPRPDPNAQPQQQAPQQNNDLLGLQ